MLGVSKSWAADNINQLVARRAFVVVDPISRSVWWGGKPPKGRTFDLHRKLKRARKTGTKEE